ncbi:hypothetical protein PSHT_00781 [Puccinia striiformis]|uniref:Uncharacterized protein n=1 Tax=Puccinia striiformis TaxID=27350 RepID=A0A2S4WM18_9BASI|nr:hypothetical protein PSHT_00781 [Puccinia striiformis]
METDSASQSDMVNSKTRRRINYSSSSPTLPTTPSSPSQRLATGRVQVTPTNYRGHLNNLLTEENAMPRPSPQKQVIMDQLIQTLQTLRARQQQQQQQQQQQSDDEQRQSKRIKIEAAPDGSASLVVSSVHPSQLHPSYYYYHQQQHQRHHPTTVAPTSLFSSPSSTSSFNPYNPDSPLVSATTQEYGRVIMKKDALINKLGLEAAHRAIRKASSKLQMIPKTNFGLQPEAIQTENKSPHKRRYDQQAINKSTQERMSKLLEKKPNTVTINQRGTTPPNQQSFFRTEEINQRGRIERYGSYSQLSFSGQQQPHIHGSSGLSSGGSTLHKMIKPGYENRKTPSSSSSSISNPQNSPHNETKNRFPNLTTPYGVLEHRWLTDVDFNRLHSSSSSPYSIDPFDDFLHQLS